MYKRFKIRFFLAIFLLLISIPLLFYYFKYISKAAPVKANILIDTQKTIGPVPDRWKAFAQGGEEKGVRMLENVVSEISGLYPRYIRLDHIYDFYDVISRNLNGIIAFDWTKLDETVCDIYHTGAKPFFSLGYMPETISNDGTLISIPKNWNEWSLVVQKTIEHYSSKSNRLCGQITGFWKTDIYYEVWNEPDLESFGKWSLYDGPKDYKTLYSYSVKGAQNASDVNHFLIGGPVTTALYKNWIQVFLNYVSVNNLRLDFISWHHYSKIPDDYTDDIINLNLWLMSPQYQKFQKLPKIISEWGYDSEPNPMADTNIGAAYTISAIRNFISAGYEMAFLFEIKDGPEPRWGILQYDGKTKPRYNALKMLNMLEGKQIQVNGEGTFVNALASNLENKTILVLTNYDPDNRNTELVPITVSNLINGTYTISTHLLDSNILTNTVTIENGQYVNKIPMPANSVMAIEIIKN